MTKLKFIGFQLALLSIFGFACLLMVTNTDTQTTVQISIGDEIFVPDGYEFVDASAYGQYANIATYYCEEISTGRIFTCTDGRIGSEIVIPEGYYFIGASAYGQYFNNLVIICGKEDSKQVFICQVQ